MRKIHRIANMALIYMLIGVFSCSNVAYSADSSSFDKLRIRVDDPKDDERLLEAQIALKAQKILDKVGIGPIDAIEDPSSVYEKIYEADKDRLNDNEHAVLLRYFWSKNGPKHLPMPDSFADKFVRTRNDPSYAIVHAIKIIKLIASGCVDVDVAYHAVERCELSSQEKQFLWQAFHWTERIFSNQREYINKTGELVKDMLKKREKLRILDIGCGPVGFALEQNIRKFGREYNSKVELFGMDLHIMGKAEHDKYIRQIYSIYDEMYDEDEIVESPKKITDYGFLVQGIQLIQGDATDLPFRENSFDLIYAHTVIDYLDESPDVDVIDVIRKIVRVLSPGGKFLISASPQSLIKKIINQYKNIPGFNCKVEVFSSDKYLVITKKIAEIDAPSIDRGKRKEDKLASGDGAQRTIEEKLKIINQVMSEIEEETEREKGDYYFGRGGNFQYSGTTTTYGSMVMRELQKKGLMTSTHTFGDIGAGIGRVLAYALVSTEVGRVIGIEPDDYLREKGQKAIVKLDQLGILDAGKIEWIPYTWIGATDILSKLDAAYLYSPESADAHIFATDIRRYMRSDAYLYDAGGHSGWGNLSLSGKKLASRQTLLQQHERDIEHLREVQKIGLDALSPEAKELLYYPDRAEWGVNFTPMVFHELYIFFSSPEERGYAFLKANPDLFNLKSAANEHEAMRNFRKDIVKTAVEKKAEKENISKLEATYRIRSKTIRWLKERTGEEEISDFGQGDEHELTAHVTRHEMADYIEKTGKANLNEWRLVGLGRYYVLRGNIKEAIIAFKKALLEQILIPGLSKSETKYRLRDMTIDERYAKFSVDQFNKAAVSLIRDELLWMQENEIQGVEEIINALGIKELPSIKQYRERTDLPQTPISVQGEDAALVDKLVREVTARQAPSWMARDYRAGQILISADPENPDSIPRKISQAKEHAKMATTDGEMRARIEQALDLLAAHPRTPHLMILEFEGVANRLVKHLSGNEQAYAQQKRQLDEALQPLYEEIRSSVRGISNRRNRLESAIVLAGIANLFDITHPESLQDIAGTLGVTAGLTRGEIPPDKLRRLFFHVYGVVGERSHIVNEFNSFVTHLEQHPGGTVMYFLDNHGEVIFDKSAIEELLHGGYRVAVVGRGKTASIDVTQDEAQTLFAEDPYLRPFLVDGRLQVVTDGSDFQGADLSQSMQQPDFLAAWQDSIAYVGKGAGTFVSLFGQRLSRPGLFVRMMKGMENAYELLETARDRRFAVRTPLDLVLVYQPEDPSFGPPIGKKLASEKPHLAKKAEGDSHPITEADIKKIKKAVNDITFTGFEREVTEDTFDLILPLLEEAAANNAKGVPSARDVVIIRDKEGGITKVILTREVHRQKSVSLYDSVDMLRDLIEDEDMEEGEKIKRSYSIVKTLAIQEKIKDTDVDALFTPAMDTFLNLYDISKDDKNINMLVRTLRVFQFLYTSEGKKNAMDNLIDAVEKEGLDGLSDTKDTISHRANEVLEAKGEKKSRNAKEKLEEFLGILKISLSGLNESDRRGFRDDGSFSEDEHRYYRSLKNKALAVLDLIHAQADADEILGNSPFIKEQILPVLVEESLPLDTQIRSAAKAIRGSV